MRIILCLLFSIAFHSVFAQFYFQRFDGVPVTQENGPVAFPWAGGINHPQFSNIDFNMDGRNDLYVFDKSGDKTVCFTADALGQLQLAPNYREMFVNRHSTFTSRMHDWVLLRDFNADGKTDVFTYSNGGLAVYRNDGNSDTLIFTLMTKKLLSDYGTGIINIYVSPTDLPAIMDVDGDSDMDLVTFSLFGTSAEYHQNQSMELYGIPDSLVMQLATPCWGDFEEDPSTVSASLNVSCKGGTPPSNGSPTSEGARHSGFTMLGLDIDDDDDKDLVLSKVSFNTMNILVNTGDATTAHMGSQDLTFPANFQNTDAIDLYTFPAAFLADVNNDGKEDLLFSSYQENNGHDYHSAYLYTNSSSGAFNLDFVQNDFLQDNMIELGTSSYPVFFDYDQDGLKDLLIGNKGYFVSTGVYSAQLAYYRNTGTATQPAFTLITRDLDNLSQLGLGNIAPTFGDIDGDGDMDMLIGAAAGLVHYFENSAGAGNPCDFSLTEPGFQGITVDGQFATPCLYDIDGDQILDLVIGERNGNLNYFHNNGTATAPQFAMTDNEFGGIDMRRNGLSFGYSAPFVFEHGGQLQMLVGSESGDIDLYNEITEVISGPEELVGTVGSGTSFSSSNETTPFGFSTTSGRNQYLIKASELLAAGLGQGVIENLSLISQNGPSVSHAQFYVKMGLTELEELNGFVNGNTTVYYASSGTVPNGLVEYDAQTPIVWDGVQNLIVEFCWYQTTGAGSDLNVQYSTTPFNSNAYSSTNNYSGCGIEYVGSNNERPNFTFTIKPSFNRIGKFPIYEGERSTIFGADMNSDGFMDFALGNLAGGLAYYQGAANGLVINSVEENEGSGRFGMHLYPNPNNGLFTIEPDVALEGDVEMRVVDMLGQMVWSGRTSNLIKQSINLSHLRAGVYLLDVRNSKKQALKRFIVQH